MKIGDKYWVEGSEAQVERIEISHCLLSREDGQTFWRARDYVEAHLVSTPLVRKLFPSVCGRLCLVLCNDVPGDDRRPAREHFVLDLMRAWSDKIGAPEVNMITDVMVREEDGVLVLDGANGNEALTLVDGGVFVFVVPYRRHVPDSVADHFDVVINSDTGEIT